MEGMSGVELATKMTCERPQLKVLLMSGFTEGMLVLNEGWHFLAKPFINSQLRAERLIVGLCQPGERFQIRGAAGHRRRQLNCHRGPPCSYMLEGFVNDPIRLQRGSLNGFVRHRWRYPGARE